MCIHKLSGNLKSYDGGLANYTTVASSALCPRLLRINQYQTFELQDKTYTSHISCKRKKASISWLKAALCEIGKIVICTSQVRHLTTARHCVTFCAPEFRRNRVFFISLFWNCCVHILLTLRRYLYWGSTGFTCIKRYIYIYTAENDLIKKEKRIILRNDHVSG